MKISNILFLSIIGLTFMILAVCDYYREVNIIYCKDQGRITYINYSYFPLRKEYKIKHNCKSKTMKNYKFYKLKQVVNNHKRR